jgi:hypothetical protein
VAIFARVDRDGDRRPLRCVDGQYRPQSLRVSVGAAAGTAGAGSYSSLVRQPAVLAVRAAGCTYLATKSPSNAKPPIFDLAQ